MPDHLSKITAKHLITSTSLKDQDFDSLNCPGAEHGEGRCEFSSMVLNIEQLGITCLVRLRPSRVSIDVDFFCDCCQSSGCGGLERPFTRSPFYCDPSTASSPSSSPSTLAAFDSRILEVAGDETWEFP